MNVVEHDSLEALELFEVFTDTELELALIQRGLFMTWTDMHCQLHLTLIGERAALLYLRHVSHGNPLDLAESVSLCQFVSEHAHKLGLHGLYLSSMLTLGSARLARLFLASKQESIALEIESHKQVLSLHDKPSLGRSKALVNLALALKCASFEDLTSRLQRSRVLLEEALCMLPEGSSLISRVLGCLGMVVCNTASNSSELMESVVLHQDAIQLCPKTHRIRPLLFYWLGSALQKCDECIISERYAFKYRESLRLMSPTHMLRPLVLIALAESLVRTSYYHFGNKDNANEGVDLLKEALALIEDTSTLHAKTLLACAAALTLRFEQYGATFRQTEHIIAVYDQAKRKARCEVLRTNATFGLCICYRVRYRYFGKTEDLAASTSLAEDLAKMFPPGYQDYAQYLGTLAERLILNPSSTPYELQGTIILFKAMLLHDITMQDFDRAYAHYCFGLLCYDRFLHDGKQSDLAYALSTFRHASHDPSFPPETRLYAAQWWVKAGESSACLEEVISACELAIDLFANDIYIGLGSDTFLRSIKARDYATLPVEGAACALTLHQPSRALMVLQQGRAVFWNRLLQFRVSFENRGLPPALAQELTKTSNRIEQLRMVVNAPDDAREEVILQRYTVYRHYKQLLQRAYEEYGFQHCLTRKLTHLELVRAADDGPLIILLSSKKRGSFAIIIRSFMQEATHLPLPLVSFHSLIDLNSTTGATTQVSRQILRDSDSCNSAEERLGIIMGRSRRPYNPLGILWSTVVKPILCFLDIKKSQFCNSRPRIWWCCTGPFTSLPVHAAGVDGPLCDYASDYVVSSYTPTSNILTQARDRGNSQTALLPSLVLVAEPEAPSCAPLPKTLVETQLVSELARPIFDQNVHLLLRHNSDDVLHKLKHACIAHFACHGYQNSVDPLASGFALRDRRLSVRDIMQLHLPHAQFAFLGACESAAIDREQPDEAVHLAAAMMFAGFRSIVATMWSMDDRDGPMVATHVYRALFENVKDSSEIDYSRIPYALDAASRKLRAEGVHWTRWATYIHVGI